MERVADIRRGQVSEIAVLAWNRKPALGRESLIRWDQLPLSEVSGWCSHCQRKPRVSLSSQGAVASPSRPLPHRQHTLSKGGLLEFGPPGPLPEQNTEAAVRCLCGTFLPWASVRSSGQPVWVSRSGQPETSGARMLGAAKSACWTLCGTRIGTGTLVVSLPPSAALSYPSVASPCILGSLKARRGWRTWTMAPRARDLRILCQLQPTSCAAYGQLLVSLNLDFPRWKVKNCKCSGS